MSRPSSLSVPFWIILIAITAAFVLAFSTPAGIGLTNDSAAYIGGARSILAGTGYSDVWLDSSLEALTHYPPLFSISLAGLGLFGLDPLRGARLLNILLFGANTALMGWLGWRMTKLQAAGIFLALLFGLNASILRVHAYALSEPLFLFFSLSAFIFFDFSVEQRTSVSKPVSNGWMLLVGSLASLAFLTRYSGLALIATFFLAIIILNSTWRARLTKSAWFLAGCLPLSAAWFIRNRLVAGNATNRTFQFHPILWDNVKIGLYNVAGFLLPVQSWQPALFKSGALTWILPLLALALLSWLGFRAYQLLSHPSETLPPSLAFTTAVYVFGYLGAVLFSMSFFDASTKFQPRILAPLYVSGMILFAAALSRIIGIARSADGNLRIKSLTALAVGFAALSLGLSIWSFLPAVSDLRSAAGLGYGSWQWRDSMVMESLKKLPSDVAIYTNSTPAVYLVTGRASRIIPTVIDPVDNLPRGDYAQNLAAMRADLLSRRAVLALFDTSDIEDALGAENFAEFIAGLTVLEKAQGDILYGIP